MVNGVFIHSLHFDIVVVTEESSVNFVGVVLDTVSQSSPVYLLTIINFVCQGLFTAGALTMDLNAFLNVFRVGQSRNFSMLFVQFNNLFRANRAIFFAF